MRGSIAQMKRAIPSLDNISWERIAREGSVTYPCDAEDQPGNEIVFGDGFPKRFGSPVAWCPARLSRRPTIRMRHTRWC
jgi:formate dehydrogenase major subunit